MHTTMRNIITVLVLAFLPLVGCSEAPLEPSTYELGAELVTYPAAVEYCASLGGELFEIEGSADLQLAYDLWLESEVPAEGVFVGNFLTPYEGVEYGYAMVRGGALVPVQTDGFTDGLRLGLALCELPST